MAQISNGMEIQFILSRYDSSVCSGMFFFYYIDEKKNPSIKLFLACYP